jgi:hypothetical protein
MPRQRHCSRPDTRIISCLRQRDFILRGADIIKNVGDWIRLNTLIEIFLDKYRGRVDTARAQVYFYWGGRVLRGEDICVGDGCCAWIYNPESRCLKAAECE